MLRLYKCKDWDEDKCKDYEGCNCRYTFDPRHIWQGSDIITAWTISGDNIEVQCDECPGPNESTVMEFYKEVEDENERSTSTQDRDA